jgi:hypothetical protein
VLRPLSRPAAALALVVMLAGGCDLPPELQPTPGPLPSPSPTAAPSPTPPPPTLEPSPTATPGFSQQIAVDCGAQVPDGDIVALLRSAGLLPAGVLATVSNGPLCAGTWQYAVVRVPDREPLQVVTRGAPGALTLVTAGTNVCTVEVRIEAPPGIRTAAACPP